MGNVPEAYYEPHIHIYKVTQRGIFIVSMIALFFETKVER